MKFGGCLCSEQHSWGTRVEVLTAHLMASTTVSIPQRFNSSNPLCTVCWVVDNLWLNLLALNWPDGRAGDGHALGGVGRRKRPQSTGSHC